MGVVRTGLGAALSVVCLAGLGAAALWFNDPPPAQPASAPASAFSAERASSLVQRIAVRPRHTGSAEHDRVRDLLVAEFETLGVPAERQAATVQVGTTAVRAARVENLVCRIPGTASTGAVLLVAHYDSVPAGPGASDGGAGVAAIVEAVRALKSGPALRNDVIVLLTDAEEFGMLGAQAFATQHPRAGDVRMVLNFEARGTSGPAQMFETSAGNGAVVAAWASSVPSPSGASLAYEIYRRLPNNTDFSILKKLDAGGLNFAFIGNPERYHTPLDTASAQDRGSLQHLGDAALAMALRFGDMDLAEVRSRDAVYFSLPVVGVALRYSSLLALPLAAALLALAILALVSALRRRETSVGGVMLAAIVFAVFAAGALFLGWRFGRIANVLHARWLPDGDVLWSAPWAAALAGVVVTAWLAVYAALRRLFAAHSIALGALTVLIAAELASAWFVVGASYVLLWPAVGSALAAMALREAWDIPPGAGPARALVIGALGAPAALILWPLVQAVYGAMGLSSEGGVAMAFLTACACGALAIQIDVAAQGRRWWPALAALGVTIACLAAGMAWTRYSERFPRPVNLHYVIDADARAAHWTVQSLPTGPLLETDRARWPDAWARQYVGESPRRGRPLALVQPWSASEGTPGYLTAEAPFFDLPTPQASLLSSARSEGGRTVTIRAVPAREGSVLTVWVHGSQALDVSVDGRRAAAPMPARRADDTAWSLDYVNAPAAGVVVTLVLRDTNPLTVAVLDRASGLPVLPGLTFAPRPPSVTPMQFGDQTVVRRTYVF